MSALGPIGIGVQWDYDDSGFRRLASDMDTVGKKYNTTSEVFDKSNIKMLRSVSRLTSTYYSLYGMIDLVTSGNRDMIQMIPRIIGLMVSLTATIMSVVEAEKMRAIAHTVANALSGPVGWAIIAGAVAAIGIGIGLAATIGTRQGGGPIYRTGSYWLEQGEIYKRGAPSHQITILVTGNEITSESLPKLSNNITSSLKASGVLK